MKYKHTEEELKAAIATSTTFRQVMEKLGVRCSGGNYATIKHKIIKFNIDTSHFFNQVWNKGKSYSNPRKPLNEILVENSNYTSTNSLRKRLLREKIFEYKCYRCNNTKWLDNPIPLELEHINGNRFDHRKENLTLLCPNCHAQTATYRGKNKKCEIIGSSKIKIVNKKVEEIALCNNCLRCKASCKHKFCSSSCSNKYHAKDKMLKFRKVERPPLDVLLKEVENLGFCATGHKYGVTDNAIRKWIKNYRKYELQSS